MSGPLVSQPQLNGGAVEGGGGAEGERAGRPAAKDSSGGGAALARKATKRTLVALANLLLAISEMFAIAALMALGTGRRRATTTSRSSRPEHNPVSGFGSGSSPPGSITCSPPRSSSASRRPSWPAPTPPSSPWSRSPEGPSSQLPMVKVARRWSFMHSGERIRKQEFADSLPRASIQDLGVILMGAGYEIDACSRSSVYVLYDQEGKLVGLHRPSSKLPIEINGNEILIEDAIGTDPGVLIVYDGFGALMLTTRISYLSHSQIWALQDGTTVVVGEKTNRAKLEFYGEINRLLYNVPKLIDGNENSVDKKLTAT
ncbi:hypothetical protein ACP4OV_028982 [Aristida adscensionis]